MQICTRVGDFLQREELKVFSGGNLIASSHESLEESDSEESDGGRRRSQLRVRRVEIETAKLTQVKQASLAKILAKQRLFP